MLLSETFSSSALLGGQYDTATMRMTLTFVSGHPYDFCGVPLRVWEGLCNASSHGTYYNDHIRDRYQCF